jgi:hypothetical protein
VRRHNLIYLLVFKSFKKIDLKLSYIQLTNMETSKMIPLKQNNRWKLDNDEKHQNDEKNNTRFNRFKSGGNSSGFHNNRGGFRNSRGRGGGFNRGRGDGFNQGRGGGFNRGRGGGFNRGRGGGFNRGRNGRYQRDNTFSKIKNQYKYNEESFPTLGNNTKQQVTLPQLNWAAAAQRGALAPPPKPKVKKITKNKLETIKKDIKYESDDEDSILSEDGVEYQNDVFPAKGGYLD